jgi:N,N'-diacetyllegionaminate synthase
MLIAEIGLNHLGSFIRANQYVTKLINSNIDGITFQVRESTYYDQPNKNNLLLTDNHYINLCNTIKSHNKKFGVAIADIDKIDFFESIGTDFYKVIRNDITNKKLIKKLIETKKELIVSTGVSSEQEIEEFLQEFGNENITLNHTQLSYDVEDCNLSAIKTLRQKYGYPISYGSHCSNENVLYMSLCYNPANILFYVKDDGNCYVPDDKHAIELSYVNRVVDNLKSLKYAIGNGIKAKMEIKIK